MNASVEALLAAIRAIEASASRPGLTDLDRLALRRRAHRLLDESIDSRLAEPVKAEADKVIDFSDALRLKSQGRQDRPL